MAKDRVSRYPRNKYGQSRPDGGPAPRWTLVLLCLLVVVSMFDRFILALMVRSLRADLGLTDMQLGLLFGTAFALLYATVGLPLGRLADRSNRKWLISGAVFLWSACTLGSAFVRSFPALLTLRAGLALGEAALLPSGYSLIYDLFGERRRPVAAAIFASAPPFGGAFAFIGGGALVTAIERLTASGGGSAGGFRAWQLIFIAVGVASLVIALLFAATVTEPRRVPAQATPDRPDSRNPGATRFVWLVTGAGACQFIGYGYAAWAPELLVHKYGMSLSAVGALLGLLTCLGSILGTITLPLIAVGRWDRGSATAPATIPAVATALGAAVYVVAPLQSSAALFFVLITLGNFLMIGSSAAVQVALQRLAPSNRRAALIAGVSFVGTGIGLGIGPPLVAWIAHHQDAGVMFDRALSLLALGTGICCATMFTFATRELAGTGRAAQRSAAADAEETPGIA